MHAGRQQMNKTATCHGAGRQQVLRAINETHHATTLIQLHLVRVQAWLAHVRQNR